MKLDPRIKSALWALAAAATVVVFVVAILLQPEKEVIPMMPSTDDMVMQINDEFKGPKGSRPDGDFWDHDMGGGGWGNGEKQIYTDDSEHASVDGSGYLNVSATRSGDDIVSARLVIRGKVEFGYRLLEARIKFPAGQGIHPAFWLLGTNIESVGYPECGEIDVVEIVNSGKRQHNALHGPWEDPGKHDSPKWKQSSDGPSFEEKVDLTDDYHVYGVYREPGKITIGIDGHILRVYTKAEAPPGAKWVFDAPMYATLNVAVGGEWPGPENANTKFPATMSVDWLRYWK